MVMLQLKHVLRREPFYLNPALSCKEPFLNLFLAGNECIAGLIFGKVYASKTGFLQL